MGQEGHLNMTRTGRVDIFLRFGVPDFLRDLLLTLWYARGRQWDWLVHWNEKKASEFALQAADEGRTIVVPELAGPEGKASQPVDLILCRWHSFSCVSRICLLTES